MEKAPQKEIKTYHSESFNEKQGDCKVTLGFMFPTSLRKTFKNHLKISTQFMRNRSFLAHLTTDTGPTRKEKDTIGEIEVPSSCLWGAQTQR